MFWKATSFNQDVSSWTTSSVTRMTGMFAESAFNQPLTLWDVSNVQDLQGMFEGASDFNQDLSSWKVGRVVDFGGMFAGATSFNQSLCSWGAFLSNTSLANTARMLRMHSALPKQCLSILQVAPRVPFA